MLTTQNPAAGLRSVRAGPCSVRPGPRSVRPGSCAPRALLCPPRALFCVPKALFCVPRVLFCVLCTQDSVFNVRSTLLCLLGSSVLTTRAWLSVPSTLFGLPHTGFCAPRRLPCNQSLVPIQGHSGRLPKEAARKKCLGNTSLCFARLSSLSLHACICMSSH